MPFFFSFFTFNFFSFKFFSLVDANLSSAQQSMAFTFAVNNCYYTRSTSAKLIHPPNQ